MHTLSSVAYSLCMQKAIVGKYLQAGISHYRHAKKNKPKTHLVQYRRSCKFLEIMSFGLYNIPGFIEIARRIHIVVDTKCTVELSANEQKVI
jgi:hypothetical protein